MVNAPVGVIGRGAISTPSSALTRSVPLRGSSAMEEPKYAAFAIYWRSATLPNTRLAMSFWSFRIFRRRLLTVSLFAALVPAAASGQSAKVGTLVCHISGGVGMILMENQALDCVFQDASGASPSHYIGRLTNVGVNIGISGPGQLVWGVVAATSTVAPGALAGDYVGAQGSVAAGVGAGGAVLVGGSDKTISLQPVSVSAETGLNLSAGVGNINLQYMPVTPPPPPGLAAASKHGKKSRH